MSEAALATVSTNRPLPKGWRCAKLGEVCRIVGGSTPATGVQEFWGGDINWITPTDLGKLKTREITGSERHLTPEGYANCGAEMAPTGAIVVSTRAPIGHLGISAVPLCTNQGCKTAIPGAECDSAFLYYALKHRMPSLRQLGSGATFHEVSKATVEAFCIALPSVPDQRRIATILDDQHRAIERARSAAEAQLEAATSITAATLRSVFSSSDAREWQSRRLGEVCSIVAPLVDPTLPEYRDLPHVNGENIESGTCRLLYLNTAAEERMTSGKYLFRAGDVLYSKLRPYLRKVVVADCDGLCSADMYPLKVNTEVFGAQFAGWLLLSDEFTKYADEESRRARMPKLNRDQLFAWEAPVPPLNVQRRIVSTITAHAENAMRLRAQINEELAALANLPPALLRRAFNGEL